MSHNRVCHLIIKNVRLFNLKVVIIQKPLETFNKKFMFLLRFEWTTRDRHRLDDRTSNLQVGTYRIQVVCNTLYFACKKCLQKTYYLFIIYCFTYIHQLKKTII